MKPEMLEVTNSYYNWSIGVGFRGTEKHEDEGAKLNTSDDRHCEKELIYIKANWPESKNQSLIKNDGASSLD